MTAETRGLPVESRDVAVPEAGSGGDDEVLRRAPLFAGVSDEAVEALLPSFVTREVRRGDAVFREGEPGSSLFVVLRGRVSLTTTDGHSESLLAVLDAGDMFGELSAFDPGPRTTSAAALESPTVLAEADRDSVLAWASTHPLVSERLLQVLARRLRRSNSTLRDLVFVDVPGRTAGVLLDLAAKYGVEDGAGLVVDHALTQVQLAQLVGSSRETVNKALSEFTSRGWVTQLATGRIALRDVAALRKRSHRR